MVFCGGIVAPLPLPSRVGVEHFRQLVAPLLNGQGKAMVVVASRLEAVRWQLAIDKYIKDRGYAIRTLVAFSGEVKDAESGPDAFTESGTTLNPNLRGREIREAFNTDEYQILLVANKFQTGFDQPLLCGMYVDKRLAGIQAVQTLSRLNRAHPQKHDCFVLDFQNNSEAITFAFQDYYRTTLLAEETDPNKLHDLKAALDNAQVYSPEQVGRLVELFLGGADRDNRAPILDACVATYVANLDEDRQVEFKGKAKVFCRTYSFLSSVIPYSNAEWEKLSVFLDLLTPKLPAPKEEDLAKGILEAIDMDSYRVEKKAALAIQLPDADAEIEPVPTTGGGSKPEPELDRLSNIIRVFNDQFGSITWTDADRVHRLITEEIPAKVAADTAYQNARKHSDRQNARIEHDKALARVMTAVLKDDTELFKQFSDNESFRRWLTDTVFALTYD
jgi:type I restriction enzyme R subunit